MSRGLAARRRPALSPASAWVHRPMTVGDLEQVMAVETTAFSHPWSRGNFIDSLAAGYHTELRLDADGALLGYWVAMPGADELHLLNITVAPSQQRQGHGQALLQRLIAHARQRADQMLWLEVRESNQPAQALYRRHGFDAVGLRRAYYPGLHGREDAVVMRLALTGAAATEHDHALD